MTEAVDNEYIVYIAYAQDSDKCLYVGSGVKDRWKHVASGISHVYEANRYHFQGFTPRIVVEHSGLTKEESLELERNTIIALQPEWNSVLYTAAQRNLSVADKARRQQSIPYQKLLKEYCENFSNGMANAHVNKLYEQIAPDLPDIVQELGLEKIKGYGYQWRTVGKLFRNAVGVKSLRVNKAKTLDSIGVRVGEFYSMKYLKDSFQKLYDAHEIETTAKATDVLDYFVCKKTTQRNQAGYLILGEQ